MHNNFPVSHADSPDSRSYRRIPKVTPLKNPRSTSGSLRANDFPFKLGTHIMVFRILFVIYTNVIEALFRCLLQTFHFVHLMHYLQRVFND